MNLVISNLIERVITSESCFLSMMAKNMTKLLSLITMHYFSIYRLINIPKYSRHFLNCTHLEAIAKFEFSHLINISEFLNGV